MLEQVILAVTHGGWPSSKEVSFDVMLFRREADSLEMKDGLLCWVGKKSNVETLQLVLPGELCGNVLRALHDDTGHLGVERVTDLL